MGKHKIKSILVFVFFVLPTFGGGRMVAAANSAQTWFEGVDAVGAMMVDKESPIIVEKELLTFDIQVLPKNYYQSAEERLEYNAKVTAEYTFYNPSAYTVTSKLLFPFGVEASYGDGYYDEGSEGYVEADDTQKYDITVNGNVVEKKIRHTLSNEYDQFELEQDLALICDGYAADDFYFPELPVTRYAFKASGVDTSKYPAACVGFDVPKGVGDYRVYFPERNGFRTLNGGEELRMQAFVKGLSPYDGIGEYKFEAYVFGTPFSDLPSWKFYEDGSVEDGEEIDGNVTLIASTEMTFEEFALSNYPNSQDKTVSKSDWYNALVAELKDGVKDWEFPIVDCYRHSKNFRRSLMRWYEYTITVAPNERIVNAVTAPLYPAINMRYSPSVYEYTYLLSPAKTWKSFGELEIAVNTPYYVTKSNIGGLKKTEKGYSVLLDGLPEGELEFELSTSETPVKNTYAEGCSGCNGQYNTVFLPVVGILAAVMKRKRK